MTPRLSGGRIRTGRVVTSGVRRRYAPYGAAYWYRPSFWIDDCPNPDNPDCPIYVLGADGIRPQGPEGDKFVFGTRPAIDIDHVTQPLATQMVAGLQASPVQRAPLQTQRLPQKKKMPGWVEVAIGGLAVYGVLKLAKII